MRVDMQLLAAAKAGDSCAMELLLSVMRPDLRRCATYYCGRVSSVDEVVQEVLLVVSRRIGTLTSLAAFSAWVATIVARICLWPALRLASGVERLLRADTAQAVPSRPLEELRIDIARALESLPLPQREVILMRDFQGLTIGEMAEQVGLSRAATKSRLHRARALVREYLVEGDHARSRPARKDWLIRRHADRVIPAFVCVERVESPRSIAAIFVGTPNVLAKDRPRFTIASSAARLAFSANRIGGARHRAVTKRVARARRPCSEPTAVASWSDASWSSISAQVSVTSAI